MRLPNFFLVGAPKCGTTAMVSYLRQHPDIFIPAYKEFHYFGTDTHYPRRPGREQYLAVFADAQAEKRVGEASTSYLVSRRAAEEIKDFSADARILIMLRNPVEMMYSLHSEVLYWVNEDLLDFEAALAAEDRRKEGDGLPRRIHIADYLYYREMARYSPQVKRYFDIFGRDNVHVILHEDCKKDMGRVFRETLEFLDVDSEFRVDFVIKNSSKRVRSRAVQDFLLNPPPLVRWVRDDLMPKRMRELVFGRLRGLNTVFEPRAPMNPDLKKRLRVEFAPEVERLGELLGRDLSHWSRDSQPNGE
jgi:hypothetical protein